MDDLFAAAPPPSILAAAIVLDELAALGVRDVVVCPGSRSAPLAYAAARLDQEARLRLHVRLDERSAGFFALGIAKASGHAVAIITTSGTAVANLAPSLAEARFGRIPLIALTADRPATLVGTGANQTANQVGIFGTIPLLVARIAAADLAPEAWRSLIRRVVVTAEGRLTHCPGPVQVNIELTPPLIGDPGQLPPGGAFQVEPAPQGRSIRLDPGPRTVIIAGDLPPDQGRSWATEAARVQIPLLAEPSSNARCGGAAISLYRHLLGGFSPQIERVIVVGHPTLSRPVETLLARQDLEIIAVDSSGQWPDPGWAVSRVVPGVRLDMGDARWMASWVQADRSLRSRLVALPPWTGEAVAARVLASVGEAEAVFLGASNPIRDADLAPIASNPPPIYANRGLAGIDGTIASAAGVATGLGRPVVALLGDLSTLHDIGSLVHPVGEPVPNLRLVIADDGGGSLFSVLEYGASRAQIGDLADWFDRLFAVPIDVDLLRVVQGFNLPVTSVSAPAELDQALAGKVSGLEVIVARLERKTRADREKHLAAWGREVVKKALG
ncbi:MAG: 2-succinyl-5-enolpyruvyl-6-hydroxy-3-cyclohexene-1-carboxylic-acid synthase [Propionibacteriaceae bacterium]|jgi:2-succinyl-5-enolpyruvyl-6-hydroxy-3-cyclohexene-1-carboxylate synthase|nr:2-succinyl-5-enolpyruvyl-6-hydroxy-3-cyclohexene-1-carboxylic-acid synthase [Propionibacteriaceae bacterium]